MHALREWLLELGPELGAATPDPIRTRLHFVTALPGGEADFVRKALERTEHAIAEAEARRRQLEADGADRLRRLAVLGVVFELQARRQWLLSISTEL